MKTIVTTRLVKAVITLATSTFTLIAIRTFIGIVQFGAVATALRDYVKPWPCFGGYWFTQRKWQCANITPRLSPLAS